MASDEMRKMVCESIIENLKQWDDDPRQPEALRYYENQLAVIVKRMKPPPTVVKLKTATLLPKDKGV